MKARQQIRIEIETISRRLGEIEKAQREIRDLGQSIDNTSRSSEELRRAGGSLRGAFMMGGAIAGMNMLTQATTRLARRIPRMTQEWAAAFGQQERVEIGLAAAIEATGRNVDRILPKYRELATEIQGLTEVGDEQALGLMAVAKQMGVQEAQMQATIEGAIGLSKAFNLDLTMATRAASAAVQGQTSLLTRYIPMLSDVASESERTAMVQQAMAAGFAQAKAEAEGFAGQQAQIKNELGDVKEQLGAIFAPAMLEGMRMLLRISQGIAKEATSMHAGFRDTGNVLADRMNVVSSATDSNLMLRFRFSADRRGSYIEDLLSGIERGTEDEIRLLEELLERVRTIRFDADPGSSRLARDMEAQLGARREIMARLDALSEERERLEGIRQAELAAEEAATARAEAEAAAARELEFRRELQEGLNDLARAHNLAMADGEEKLVLLAEERLRLQEAHAAAIEAQDLTAALKAQENLLGVDREILSIRRRQTEEAQRANAQEIAALAKLRGLVAVGDGRFRADTLTRAERSRASVRGQDTFRFDSGSQDFVRDGGSIGGLADPEQHFQSIHEGAMSAVYDYMALVGTLGDQIHRAYAGIFQGIQQGISGSIAGLLDGTMSWGMALENIRNSIVTSIIQSFSDMAAEWITQQLIMATVGRSLRAQAQGEQAASAAASAASWTPAAMLSSIASFGAAAAVGTAAVTAALVAFKDGGYVSGPGGPRDDRIPALLSDGEYVINAAATRRARPILEAINAGQDPATAAGGGGARAVGGQGPQRNTHVVMAWTESDIRRAFEGAIGDDVIVQAVMRNKTTIGIS